MKKKIVWKKIKGLTFEEVAVVGGYIVGSVVVYNGDHAKYIGSKFNLGTVNPFAPDVLHSHSSVGLAKKSVERQFKKFCCAIV